MKKNSLILVLLISLIPLFSTENTREGEKETTENKAEILINEVLSLKEISYFYGEGRFSQYRENEESEEVITSEFKLCTKASRNGSVSTAVKTETGHYLLVEDLIEDRFWLNEEKTEGNTTFDETIIPLQIMLQNLKNRDFDFGPTSEVRGMKTVTVTAFEKAPRAEVLVFELTTDETPSEDESKEEIQEEEEETYAKALYEKIVYHVNTTAKTLLKTEFFVNKSDKTPRYISEALDVKYINGKYIVTAIKITDTESKSVAEIEYKPYTMLYGKDVLKQKKAGQFKFSEPAAKRN